MPPAEVLLIDSASIPRTVVSCAPAYEGANRRAVRNAHRATMYRFTFPLYFDRSKKYLLPLAAAESSTAPTLKPEGVMDSAWVISVVCTRAGTENRSIAASVAPISTRKRLIQLVPLSRGCYDVPISSIEAVMTQIVTPPVEVNPSRVSRNATGSPGR